jgi:hypothetical protein
MLLNLLSLEAAISLPPPTVVITAPPGFELHPRMVERRKPRHTPVALEAWMPFVEAGALTLEEAIVLCSAQDMRSSQ